MIQLKPRYWALIAAGGIGQRMGSGVPKQYRMLGGMTVLERCVRQLARVQALSGFVVGALEHPVIEVLATDSKNFLEGRTFIRSDAGEIRAETVLNGISRIEQYAAPDDWVLIHDAARPLVAPGDVERLINAVGDHAVGGLLGWPVTDSIALVKDNMMVQSVDREGLWRAATPQMFRIQDLRAALESALARGDTITDEASVLSACGKHPLWVACSPTNFKLTTPEDFAMAEKIISAKPTTRVGTGFDVHAFSEGRKLVLGGVEIPHDRGLAGHSDADVLLHAICDACLGAAALGDLGHHFPDTDARYKGIDSRQLLRHVNTLLGNKGFRLVNIDASVIAQAPRLAPFVASMTANIAADCGLASDAVSVKATTTEGLGFAGREEGIAAQAVVTVVTGNDLL